MAIQYSSVVEKFEQQLQARYDRLLTAIQGRERTAPTDPASPPQLPQRLVNDSDVRVAVDDFATILKEIKATLGKR